ncbi:LytTR family DNA-binding domain-containing protein [Algimonas porphyrae]|uniref:LytTr DNA-binding domain protein n=1 Tax=Algimonas porphyrae TaxID=1128113 RepID=A0ABQ5V5L7_9PROT|nr:LytTR family DNA-binding domain-containing protein [Algimonas porphyrae]GLQ21876.1 LytTr DNA-binding domain protein [Algimonas porphyrae]
MKLLRRFDVSAVLTPLIAGAVLTVLAPLGTHIFSLPLRALYWISLCFAGGFGAMAVRFGLNRWRPSAPAWLCVLLQSFGSTIAVAPFVLFTSSQSSVWGFFLTLFYIWVIAIVITAFADTAARSRVAGEAADAPKRPALMDRLPVHLRHATLYGVSSEDHYVRIHTSAGDHMMLMRLADIDDLAQPVSGLRPHRSWWVAEGGVDRMVREKGKPTLILKDGTHVPVSRTGARTLRDAGWLT